MHVTPALEADTQQRVALYSGDRNVGGGGGGGGC